MSTVEQTHSEVSQATRKSSREQQPNVRLSPEEIESERIQHVKNSKRGFLSTVTQRKNEIKDLIRDDNNLNLVNEKLKGLNQSFIKYSEAHQAYQAVLSQLKLKLQNKTNTKRREYVTLNS